MNRTLDKSCRLISPGYRTPKLDRGEKIKSIFGSPSPGARDKHKLYIMEKRFRWWWRQIHWVKKSGLRVKYHSGHRKCTRTRILNSPCRDGLLIWFKCFYVILLWERRWGTRWNNYNEKELINQCSRNAADPIDPDEGLFSIKWRLY